jgi:hypothetical protein
MIPVQTSAHANRGYKIFPEMDFEKAMGMTISWTFSPKNLTLGFLTQTQMRVKLPENRGGIANYDNISTGL